MADSVGDTESLLRGPRISESLTQSRSSEPAFSSAKNWVKPQPQLRENCTSKSKRICYQMSLQATVRRSVGAESASPLSKPGSSPAGWAHVEILAALLGSCVTLVRYLTSLSTSFCICRRHTMKTESLKLCWLSEGGVVDEIAHAQHGAERQN